MFPHEHRLHLPVASLLKRWREMREVERNKGNWWHTRAPKIYYWSLCENSKHVFLFCLCSCTIFFTIKAQKWDFFHLVQREYSFCTRPKIFDLLALQYEVFLAVRIFLLFQENCISLFGPRNCFRTFLLIFSLVFSFLRQKNKCVLFSVWMRGPTGNTRPTMWE